MRKNIIYSFSSFVNVHPCYALRVGFTEVTQQFSSIMIVITICTSGLSIYPFLEISYTAIRMFSKNQYPPCIREPTMKMRTRTILAACFAIVTFNKFGTASVKVSSKVDLDSDENEETLSNATFDTVANPNESADPLESISRAFKPSIISWHHGSELVKSNEPRKRRIYFSQDNSTKRPQIINNIQIVINSNDSLSNRSSCKDSGICDVSVSSKPDGKGNIVTEVHLSITTNTKPDAKVDDVPVIDSFRGISEDHEEKPIFHPINLPNPSYSRRENIPQVTKFVPLYKRDINVVFYNN